MSQKIISADQLSLGISSHNNHYLFSDHYLNHILKTDARWREAIPAGEAFLAWVTGLYEQEKAQLGYYSESQLESHWFKPIWQKLGHIFEGQAKIPGLTSGVKFPDYVFFPDELSRQQAAAAQQTPAYSQHALAVGEVKKWDIPLGKKSQGNPSFENNNPSYQIDYYLRATDLTWGLLSNGRLWRLVHKDSSYRLDVYFELDLVQAIEEQNLAAAIFFTLFFRQQAFRADGQGRHFLQDALTASARYTLELENDLRDNAYKALEHLIQGFIEPGANQLSVDDLPAIYTNSLYLLYRIIFLFYGESRDLLPIANPEYQKYSLTLFARDVATRLDSGYKAAPMTDEYWSRLKRLFAIINGSQPDLNQWLGVPRYNGGLFNPALHPFLETHFVGDRYLLAAIDVLARREVGDKKSDIRRENVDYRTLGVRQLGSIYEGLLEYQPQRATEPMVAVKKTKGEEWLPAQQKPAKAQVLDTRAVGDIFLVTDKGERKATGSYYTPDYIVKYIVEQTLGPLIEQVKQTIQPSPKPSEGFTHPSKPLAKPSEGSAFVRKPSEGSANRFAREILKLNVVDPAMGSGHFLVEATDFLARAIATDESVTVTEAAAIPDDDLVYWRRQVVEACIYGVDKNPMAVELAKLSLWLVTVARDKPLSFLDHHLRHGDSLVGARLADLERLPTSRTSRAVAGLQTAPPRRARSGDRLEPVPEQPLLLDESALTLDANRAVQGMMLIEQLMSDSIEDIHHKEKALAELQSHLTRWRHIADLWTSSFFGNAMSPQEYADLVRYLQGQGNSGELVGTRGNSEELADSPTRLLANSLLTPQQRQRYLGHPAVMANDYFHWELEFPELFFDQYGRHKGEMAGFDAVIGNPPYVRQELLAPLKLYLQSRFSSFHGMADLYLYFFELGISLLNRNGLMAYISSGSFARSNFAKPFREWLYTNARINTLIDFGENQPFAGAEMIRPSILVLQNGSQSSNFRTLFMEGTTILRPLEQAIEQYGFECTPATLQQPEWIFQSTDEASLFGKILRQSQELKVYLHSEIFRGVLTGFNDAFYITGSVKDELIRQDQKSRDIIKPILRGGDLRPWYQQQEDQWLIFTRRGIEIDQYPAVKQYLLQYRTQLEPRPDNWSASKNWLGRKPGPYEWYEIQDVTAYYEEFDTPKVFWPKIGKLPRFSWDNSGLFINDTGYFIPYAEPYLLALLQSRVIWFSISKICTPLRLRAGLWQYNLFAQFAERLPIPEVAESLKEPLGNIAMGVTELANSRYQLHQQVRHRIQADLGAAAAVLNNALTSWWELDFSTFRTEIKKVFKRDIPLKERHDWETFLADARQQHHHLTQQIITHETALNQQVYALFHLTPDEITLIEASTKYPYGEV